MAAVLVVVYHQFQLFQCAAKLVGAGCSLETAADAVELVDDIVNPLSPHKLADSLKVSTASAFEIHVLDDVILVSRHFNQLRASSLCFILYLFHTLSFLFASRISIIVYSMSSISLIPIMVYNLNLRHSHRGILRQKAVSTRYFQSIIRMCFLWLMA